MFLRLLYPLEKYLFNINSANIRATSTVVGLGSFFVDLKQIWQLSINFQSPGLVKRRALPGKWKFSRKKKKNIKSISAYFTIVFIYNFKQLFAFWNQVLNFAKFQYFWLDFIGLWWLWANHVRIKELVPNFCSDINIK